MASLHKTAPHLWFDHRAEEAANFYVGIFKNSRIKKISRYGETGQEIHGMPTGSVMMVAFELVGQPLTAFNGGPRFRFNEAVSLQVDCATQKEVDDYWDKLSDGGDPAAQQCGWLKDRYGLSWQIVPTVLQDMMNDLDPLRAQRVMAAMLQMKKIDIEGLKRAFTGPEIRPVPAIDSIASYAHYPGAAACFPIQMSGKRHPAAAHTGYAATHR